MTGVPGDTWLREALDEVEESGNARLVLCSGNCGGFLSRLEAAAGGRCRVVSCSAPLSGGGSGAALGGDVASTSIYALGAAAGLFAPVLGLVAAAVAVGHSMLERRVRDSLERRNRGASDVADGVVDSVGVMADVLADLGDSGPVLVDLGRMEGAEGRLLLERLGYLIANHQLRVPVLIVAAVDGPERLASPGRPGDEDPLAEWGQVAVAARLLVDAGTARWWWFPPLAPHGVAEWLGSVDDAWLGAFDDNLARLLCSVSGGDSLLTVGVWRRWLTSGFAHRDRGRWSAGGQPEPVEQQVDDVIHARLDPSDWSDALKALTWGGLASIHRSGRGLRGRVSTENAS